MIRITDFKGELPKVHPQLLPDNYGQQATNCTMRSGAIKPLRSVSTAAVETFGAVAQIVRLAGDEFIPFDTVAWIVPGPVATDRYYVAASGDVPLVRDKTATYSYPLALDPPAAAPAVSLTAGAVDPALKEELVFVYTWVTSLDEESQPSPASAAIDWSPGATITITTFSATPAGRGIDRRRIYRSVTSFDGTTTLHFIAEIVVATLSFAYDDTIAIGEPIPSVDYDPPPDDLLGFTAMANGMIAAYRDREVLFCEPYAPHAWPLKYRLQLGYTIAGLAFVGDALVVPTAGQPYIIQGSHPSAMVTTEVEESLPCLSGPRGVVDLGYACAYPSSDGLVLASTSGAKVVSLDLYSREAWLALAPSTFIAVPYDGTYLFQRDDGSKRLAAFDLTGDRPYHVQITGDWRDVTYDRVTGNVYLLDEADGVTVRRFDDPAGVARTWTWRSKPFVLPYPVNVPWARVQAELTGGTTVTTTIRVTSALTTLHSWTDTVNQPVRLPGGRQDDLFEILMQGTAVVSRVAMGFALEDVV